MDDFSEFKDAMGDVTPLKVEARVSLNKSQQSHTAIAQRRQAAVMDLQDDPNHLSDTYVHMVQPYDILEYKKDGVQEGVYRKFRLGKYQLDARLDLHRKTVQQAREDVFRFIEDAMKYDLRTYCPVGAILFDHPDPSIFTVLTSPSDTAGVANLDFVIFPPRWLVGEDTFRPPWYHRNLMSELMGLVTGVYDAKAEGFVPGGASLHSRMSAHGPDAETTEHAENAELKPHKLDGTMASTFETHAVFRVSAHKEG